MTQPCLFDDSANDASGASGSGRVGLPHSGTDTSRQAAFSMLPMAAVQAAQVLVFVVERGDFGATDFEIQDALKMTGDSERPRRWELQRRGLVKDSGQRRNSPRGRKAIVYVATEQAHSFRQKPTTQAS